MKTTNALCIYHGGCTDGFAAAWVVHRAFIHPEFYLGVYQQPPPDVTGRRVIMVDFSYKRDVMLDMLDKCDSLLILDHHISAAEDLKDIRRDNFRAVFDMNRSGATLTWDYFMQAFGAQRPTFLNYIEDQDLWKKQLFCTDEFARALRSYPQDFDVWDDLFTNNVVIDVTHKPIDRLIEQGVHIQRAYEQQKDRIKEQVYIATLGGHRCAIVNMPYIFASEVANEIITNDIEFGAGYYERADGQFVYSLRSIGDFDVSKIAMQFGGGGHKNAAGFSSDKPEHIRF